MAERKKENKKIQFLLFGLCSVVAMAVCLAVLIVTVRSVESENTGTAQYDTLSKTALKDDAENLSAYLKKLTEEAAGNKFIKVDTYTDIFVDDASVTVCDLNGNASETDKNILIYAKNKMMSVIDGYYKEDHTGVFGTVYPDMPTIDLTTDKITASSFSVGEADDDGNPVYDSESGELIDGDYYFIKLCLDDSGAADDASLSKLFSLSEKEAVVQRFLSDISSVCTVADSQISLAELSVNAKVNRLSDEIEYITFEKTYSVTADVNFINELGSFGSKRVSFEYKVSGKFEYYYAGIKFSETSVTVEEGSEINLSVSAVIEDDSDYTVTFSSSDTSVATVDEMGYVKGISPSEAPVTVTVTLEYLGSIFTDECPVYVTGSDS